MSQTSVSCPRCRQPVIAEIFQLFDVSANPQMKQILLSGGANVVQCPQCGFQGPLNLPIVYHDHSKELLLTYFPVEAGVPLHEQEKTFGPLIKQVVNRLPAEARKAYLFQPQSMFSFQSMIDRILEADGITKEMREAQEKRFDLLKKMLEITDENYSSIIEENMPLIDEEFFGLLTQITQMSAAQRDEQTTKNLIKIQNELTEKTELGKQLKQQSEIIQKTIVDLQELSKADLTREKLLDFVIANAGDMQLNAIVTSIRPALDYIFFQILSEKIEHTEAGEKESLESLRDKLLMLTAAMDKTIEKQMQRSKEILNKILDAPDLQQELMNSLQQIDQLFVEVLQAEIQDATTDQQSERLAKLNQIVEVLQSLNPPSQEVEIIEQLLELTSEEEQTAFLEKNNEAINENMINMLSNVITQAENSGQQFEELNKIKAIFKLVLKFSMKKQMDGN